MAYSWKVLLEQVTGNGVISEVDALTYDIQTRQKTTCFMGN